MKIHPFDAALGADVEDVDLSAISEHDFETLYGVWLERGVLRVRDQLLDDRQLEAFSSRFGPLKEIPVRLTQEERRRIPSLFVTVISNVRVNGAPIGGLGNTEAAWHSDMTFSEVPPPASVLYSIEIPEVGGNTQFACQEAGLATLPPVLRDLVRGLSIKHDATHTSVGELRRGYEAIDDVREVPGATHPIVKRHAETERDNLFLGRRDYAYVAGLPVEESEGLLDELWRYAALPENVWTQNWRVGDVIIWDNRRVLHRRDEFDSNARRLLKRCQVLAREPGARDRGTSA